MARPWRTDCQPIAPVTRGHLSRSAGKPGRGGTPFPTFVVVRGSNPSEAERHKAAPCKHGTGTTQRARRAEVRPRLKLSPTSDIQHTRTTPPYDIAVLWSARPTPPGPGMSGTLAIRRLHWPGVIMCYCDPNTEFSSQLHGGGVGKLTAMVSVLGTRCDRPGHEFNGTAGESVGLWENDMAIPQGSSMRSTQALPPGKFVSLVGEAP